VVDREIFVSRGHGYVVQSEYEHAQVSRVDYEIIGDAMQIVIVNLMNRPG